MRSRLIFFAIIAMAGTVAFVSARGESTSAENFERMPTLMATPVTLRSADKLDLMDGEYDGRPITRTDKEWQLSLSPNEYYILRREGTEKQYTGALLKNKRKGTYYCAACGLAVFASNAKYDSGTGWPAFYRPIFRKNVQEKIDRSLTDEERIEIECARCGSHLGHVFDDGPPPTGLRYCINSTALRFKAAN